MNKNQKLILIMGASGSGKSTKAKQIMELGGFIHLETDNYFINDDGEYHFDHKKLKEAHDHCFNEAVKAISKGKSVIVSNTFSKAWERKPYLQLARSFDIEPEVFHMKGQYKNVHNVPDEIVKRQLDNLEPYVRFEEKSPYEMAKLTFDSIVDRLTPAGKSIFDGKTLDDVFFENKVDDFITYIVPEITKDEALTITEGKQSWTSDFDYLQPLPKSFYQSLSERFPDDEDFQGKLENHISNAHKEIKYIEDNCADYRRANKDELRRQLEKKITEQQTSFTMEF